ncbi:MAG: hypothetical protein ACRDJU_07955 [Actinomycetota bacterium]
MSEGTKSAEAYFGRVASGAGPAGPPRPPAAPAISGPTFSLAGGRGSSQSEPPANQAPSSGVPAAPAPPSAAPAVAEAPSTDDASAGGGRFKKFRRR